MNSRQVIGLLLMAVCIAGLVAWILHPLEGNDSNLLVRSFGGAVLGGGAFMAWMFLVRKRPASRV
jgi:hypothetical protein